MEFKLTTCQAIFEMLQHSILIENIGFTSFMEIILNLYFYVVICLTGIFSKYCENFYIYSFNYYSYESIKNKIKLAKGSANVFSILFNSVNFLRLLSLIIIMDPFH